MEMTDGRHLAPRSGCRFDRTAKPNSDSHQVPDQKTTHSELAKLGRRVYFAPFRDPSPATKNCGSIDSPAPLGQVTLPDCVTVARVTLNHLVEVRILVGQLFSTHIVSDAIRK